MVIPIRRQFQRRRAHEAELSGLARRIMRPAGIAGDRPGDGRGEHDPSPTAARQRRRAGPHAKEGAGKVGRQHLVPLRQSHLHHTRGRKHAGVGAENVDAAVPLERRGRHSLDIAGIADIGGAPAGASPFRPNRRRRRLGLRQITANHQHLRALGCKHARDATADAPAASRDDDRPAGDGGEHIDEAPLLAVPFRQINISRRRARRPS